MGKPRGRNAREHMSQCGQRASFNNRLWAFQPLTPGLRVWGAGCLGADAFQFHATHRVGSAESFLHVENFQSGQSAFAVVVSGDPFGQMFGRNGRFAERDTECVNLWVVAYFHGCSKIVCVDRHDNNFGGFLDKDRSNLFRRIEFAILFFAVRKIFSAFETLELGRLPGHGANGAFDFGNGETAPGRVTRCVIGKPNWFHRMRLNSGANPNETKNERRSRRSLRYVCAS